MRSASAAGRSDGDVGGLGQRGAAEHHDDRSGPVTADLLDLLELRRTDARAGREPADCRGEPRQCVIERCEIDKRNAELLGHALDAQEQDRELFLQVGAEQHDRGRGVDVGDLGTRQPEDHLGRQAVAELRVDVVGADDALREPRPHVRVLVRATRPAEHGDGTGPVQVAHTLDLGGRGVERFRPGHLDELARLASHRVEDARV